MRQRKAALSDRSCPAEGADGAGGNAEIAARIDKEVTEWWDAFCYISPRGVPMGQLLFSFKGRFSRLEYLAILALHWVLLISVGLLLNLVEPGTVLTNGLGFVAIVGVFWILFAAMSKRFHDAGWSGASCFLLLVPLVNIIVPIVLLFFRGEVGRNIYGEPRTGFFRN